MTISTSWKSWLAGAGLLAVGAAAGLLVADPAPSTVASAAAATPQGVEAIVAAGEVRIGVLTGAPPFGTVDERGNPAGYDVDVANLVAEYLGVPVKLVPLTPPARIPALEAGKVDFLVATLAPTPARARTVMFTMPYSAFRMVIAAPKETAIAKLDELAGKRVGVNRGSSQEAALTKLAVPGMEVVRFEDDSTVAQALIASQIDAMAMPDTVVESIRETRPEADVEVKFTFFEQPNAMAVRKDSFELRQWLNNAIYYMKVMGDLDAIARKWTGQPVPQLPVF
jgi:polar amino acid transport system substrate-binding protein